MVDFRHSDNPAPFSKYKKPITSVRVPLFRDHKGRLCVGKCQCQYEFGLKIHYWPLGLGLKCSICNSYYFGSIRGRTKFIGWAISHKEGRK